MNICWVGKYPPIEGAVSTKNYWAARGLAARGNNVYVVTNANEVEAAFRISLMPEDASHYAPRFERGFVKVVTSSVPESELGYIPTANPYLTKLASLAIDTVRRYACDVIVANYFEPYAVAGYLAAHVTQRPLIVKHSGSDLSHLMRQPELATIYKEVLRGATCVLTSSRLRDRFVGFGVDPSRIGIDPRFALPAGYFNPSVPDLLELGSSYTLPALSSPNGDVRVLDHALPAARLGIYGKVGEYKGSFDLVRALGVLGREGRRFAFLAMTQGDDPTFDRFKRDLIAEGLAGASVLIPFLPHWRVPNYVRTCSAVCFLERDFPIKMHGPMVPREIAACGIPLVISKEFAAKQSFSDRFVDGQNVWLVADPRDREELAGVLRMALSSEFAESVSAGARELAAGLEEDFDEFIERWMTLLESVVTGSAAGSLTLPSAPGFPDRIAAALPALAAVLGEDFVAFAETYEREHDGDASLTGRREAFAFLDDVERWGLPVVRERFAFAVDLIRYARRSLEMQTESLGDAEPNWLELPASDTRIATLDADSPLRPRLARGVLIESFAAPVLEMVQSGRANPGDDAPAAEVLVLFKRTINLERCEVRINAGTQELLKRCDGTRAVADIVASFPGERAAVAARVVAALQRMYRLGALAFCDESAPA